MRKVSWGAFFWTGFQCARAITSEQEMHERRDQVKKRGSWEFSESHSELQTIIRERNFPQCPSFHYHIHRWPFGDQQAEKPPSKDGSDLHQNCADQWKRWPSLQGDLGGKRHPCHRKAEYENGGVNRRDQGWCCHRIISWLGVSRSVNLLLIWGGKVASAENVLHFSWGNTHRQNKQSGDNLF